MINRSLQSLLQTELWADFKSRHGWRAHCVPVGFADNPILVLERELAFGQSMFYAPEATLNGATKQDLATLTNAVRSLNPRAFLFRLEGFDLVNDQLTAKLVESGFKPSFEQTQPRYRQWLDLTLDEPAILSRMKEKGRYNTRLALKRGVVTQVSTNPSDIEVFYSLFAQTAQRDGFSIRAKDYYLDLCQTLFASGQGELVIAKYADQPLAVLLITYADGLASYLYGASSSDQRQLMAPYVAHWQAIRRAKELGCHTYDLLQIAPSGAKDNHRYAKLTRFKQQFGGLAVELIGGWDFVYLPLVYTGFKWAQQLRRH